MGQEDAGKMVAIANHLALEISLLRAENASLVCFPDREDSPTVSVATSDVWQTKTRTTHVQHRDLSSWIMLV